MVAPLSNDALVATGLGTENPRPPRSPRDSSTGPPEHFPEGHTPRVRTRGRVAPPAASGYCPCVGETRQVIAVSGHAIAWSALLAFDFRDGVAIGVVVGSDVSDDELGTLRDNVVGALEGG